MRTPARVLRSDDDDISERTTVIPREVKRAVCPPGEVVGGASYPAVEIISAPEPPCNGVEVRGTAGPPVELRGVAAPSAKGLVGTGHTPVGVATSPDAFQRNVQGARGAPVGVEGGVATLLDEGNVLC